ncbi:MAG: 3-oxoacyl-[acyl-carrier-protein] synthase III C-terminal domain-containing protein [Kofleriaceae bacterium]
MATGILGLGTFLPPSIRTNAWWPADVIAGWHDRVGHSATRGEPAGPTPGLGLQRTFAAMAEYADDPFRGARERHVMDGALTVPQMEANAARIALARARVAPSEIDVVLAQTPVPEHLMVNGACTTHRLLELPRRCLVLGTEGACNGFALHFSLASALIASGQAKRVLSLHSSAITRVHGPSEPQSAWWGDGAAAAVFGDVGEGRGLLAAVHQADGSSSEALVLGVPGARWWEPGAITTHAVDKAHTRTMLVTLADRAAEAIAMALTEAGVRRDEVELYASHQGTAWFTKLTAQCAGISHAKTLVTFPALGNMNSVNVPYILATAEAQGLVRDGAIAVTFSGGLGETWSALVVKWGRA